MSELKPCPFCGGEAKFFTKASSVRNTVRGWSFGIFCTKCGITTTKTDYCVEIKIDEFGEIVIVVDERQDAAKAWNRRATDE